MKIRKKKAAFIPSTVETAKNVKAICVEIDGMRYRNSGAPTVSKHRNRAGGYAWVGLAAYIVIYDIIAGYTRMPTLSRAFHSASTRKFRGYALLAFWVYLTGHLFRWTPERYDLFRNLDRVGTKRFN